MHSSKNGYKGPLVIEREVGDQAGRLRDVALGLAYLREYLERMRQPESLSGEQHELCPRGRPCGEQRNRGDQAEPFSDQINARRN